MRTPRGMECDHIHHNTLDNRKSELRNCTRSQNQRNQKVKANSKTGFKGVTRHYKSGYQVRVTVNRKSVYCKTFPSLEEAVTAYEKADKKYHGEFANLGDEFSKDLH